jgi:hypothetical protein
MAKDSWMWLAYTLMNNDRMPQCWGCRGRRMQLTIVAILAAGFVRRQAALLAAASCRQTSRATRITATKPAHETRVGSSRVAHHRHAMA